MQLSCGLEEGFDPLPHVQAMFKAIPNRQLVEEYCTQYKSLGICFALSWDLAVSLKHTFELFVPVLDGEGAQFVKHAPDLASRIVCTLFSVPPGADQDAPGLGTVRL